MINYLVSVIIPTYKRADMLPRAIDSVLNQTYENIEVLVIDDNDPKSEWRSKTENIMAQYADNDKVIYIRHEKNMNGSVARNTGIKNAKGEIICFLDDDDIFYPAKTEKQLKYLIEHPEFRAVYCGWDRDGIVIPEKEGDMSFDLLSGINLIYTNVIMMYREDAINCGGWDETFKRHQEAAFMLRFFRCGGRVGVVSECLVKFDTSDRSNAAKNSVIHEEQMIHYLSTYKNEIEKCESYQKNSSKFIYSNRFRGVFFEHLKGHNLNAALKVYFKMTQKYPIAYNKNILKYIIGKFF